MFNHFVLVRSFGIIGGGAVLVAATGLAGVGPLVGEKKNSKNIAKYFICNFYSRWWRNSRSRRSRSIRHLQSSVLPRAKWSVLSPSARAQTWQIQMSKILLEGQLWTHLPFCVSQKSNYLQTCVYMLWKYLWEYLYISMLSTKWISHQYYNRCWNAKKL